MLSAVECANGDIGHPCLMAWIALKLLPFDSLGRESENMEKVIQSWDKAPAANSNIFKEVVAM